MLLGKLVPARELEGNADTSHPPPWCAPDHQKHTRYDDNLPSERTSDSDSTSHASDSDRSGIGGFSAGRRATAEQSSLDPSHRFAGFILPLVTVALRQFKQWLLDGRFLDWAAESEGTPLRGKSDSGPRRPESSGTLEAETGSDAGEDASLTLGAVDDSDRIACPFYRRNPEENQKCLARASLKSCRQVVMHLWAFHRYPPYCPVCWKRFDTPAARDRHIVARSCNLIEGSVSDGMTSYQIQRLASRLDDSWSQEDQWYWMWISSSAASSGDQPYLSGDVESAVWYDA